MVGSTRKCHSQTQTIPSKKASAGNCLPMLSLPSRKRLPTVTDASACRHGPRRSASRLPEYRPDGIRQRQSYPAETHPLDPCQLVVVEHPAVKSEITSIVRWWAQYQVFNKYKSNNTYKRSNNRTVIINMIYRIKHLLTVQIHALQSSNSFIYISNKYIKQQCNFTSQIRKNDIFAIQNTTNH